MKPVRISFELTAEDRLDRLAAFIDRLAEAKANNDFRDDVFWDSCLDEQARTSFWRPTQAELKDWERRWLATPVERRATEPSLQTPWEFGSLLDAARNAEISNLRLQRVPWGGTIEFDPDAWPYGGTGWIRALVEAFGGRVTEQSTSTV